MKSIFLFIIFLLSMSNVKSQNTWEFFHKEKNRYNVIDHMVEINDQNFISTEFVVFGLNSDYENTNYALVQKRHGESGNIYKEVVYKIDSLSTRLDWIFYNPDKETYTIVGSAHKYFNEKRRGYFVVTHWDEELNLLSDTLVRLQPLNENNFIFFINGVKSSENEYLVIGNYKENLEIPINKKSIFAKINDNGHVLHTNWMKEFNGNHCSIIEDKVLDRLILPGQITYFTDYEFNKIDSITTFNSIDYFPQFSYNTTRFKDSLFLVTANIKYADTKGLALFDKNMKLVKSIAISKPNFFVDQLFQKKSLDFIDTSTIYMGTQFGDSGYYTLAKVNSNLQPYWIRYMSENDTIAHAIMGLVACSDGGFLVYGIKGKKVDYPIPVDYGTWILKLDENGNTVSTADPVPGKWEITVFPNPSAGEFRIDIAGDSQDATLMLFDMQGRMMRNYEQLGQGQHTFDFSDLPVGTYIWKLMHKGKALGEDRWVKVR